jgi:hypothetical protein
MPYIPDQQKDTGSFIATTNVWDVSQIYETEIGSQEFKELFVRLYQNINNIVLALNTKDSAFYLTEEFVNGQIFTNLTDLSQLALRPVFRKFINIGPLGALATIPHGLAITNTWKFTRIYGVASDTVNLLYYPLPWASAAGLTNIELKVNVTDVIVTNNSGIAFTDCYVIVEMVKL